MAQALANILLHTVFSTKHRHPFLSDPLIRKEMHAYLGGTSRNLGSEPLCVGGTADHVHLLTAHTRTVAVADWVCDIKRSSSLWIKERSDRHTEFHWQTGYGVFSLGLSDRNTIKDYITRQDDHHHNVTFQEEYRRLLNEHGIEFDERYVWD